MTSAVPSSAPAPAMLCRLASLLTRRYPFLSGCGSLADASALRALTGSGVVCTRLPTGEQILVRADDYIGRAVLLFGDLDPKISAILRRVLRPGDTVVDVGANCGLVALQAARLVGPRGRVHAFEPQADPASMLTESAFLNGFAHLYVHRTALSDHDGRMSLRLDPANSGKASLSRTEPVAGRTVRVRRAADALEELRLGPVRLLKLDVEGHEAEVLDGAAGWLARRPADFVLFESHRQPTPFRRRAAVRILAELGYEFREVRRSLLRLQLAPVGRDPDGNDFLAFRRNRAVRPAAPSEQRS